MTDFGQFASYTSEQRAAIYRMQRRFACVRVERASHVVEGEGWALREPIEDVAIISGCALDQGRTVVEAVAVAPDGYEYPAGS